MKKQSRTPSDDQPRQPPSKPRAVPQPPLASPYLEPTEEHAVDPVSPTPPTWKTITDPPRV